MSEAELLAHMREIAAKNRPMVQMIGQGYYGTHTPPAIQRNVLENPAWYTAYTPYQPEIAQGRLEALLNFQTMVADLTGLPVANASLLDEATACAEAMVMAERVAKSKARGFFVDAACHPQNIAVMRTRAEPLGIEVIVGEPRRSTLQRCLERFSSIRARLVGSPIRLRPSPRCTLKGRWRSWLRIFLR
jgi:glycine dehydrogenase